MLQVRVWSCMTALLVLAVVPGALAACMMPSFLAQLMTMRTLLRAL